NWHLREGAVRAFGLILEGPDPNKTNAAAKQILQTILQLMNDPFLYVRHTAAWCFGRICQLVPQSAISFDFVPQLRKSLFEANHIAYYVCWSISSLAQFFGNEDIDISPFRRSDIVADIIKALLSRAEKKDVDTNVINACFEALKCGSLKKKKTRKIKLHKRKQTYSTFFQKKNSIDMVKQFLANWTDSLANVAKTEEISDQQLSLLSNTLSTITVCNSFRHKEGGGGNGQTIYISLDFVGLDSLDLKQIDTLMDYVTKLETMHPVVIEEALLCISCVARMSGEDFFPLFCNTLVQSMLQRSMDIESHNNAGLCQVGATVIGDCLLSCTRTIRSSIVNDQVLQRFTNEIVCKLLTLLLSINFPLEYKPHLLSTLADVSIAFGSFWDQYSTVALKNGFHLGNFEKFFARPKEQNVFLRNLALQELPSDAEEEDVKAMNDIRDTLIDVCRTTMLAIEEKEVFFAFTDIIDNFLRLLQFVTKNSHHSEGLIKNIVEFINEMVDGFCANRDAKRLLDQLKVGPMQDFLSMAASIPSQNRLAKNALNVWI
ncbi:hypothetical protein RFI_02377, partial [Reticulomyxa filosa]